MADFEYSSFSPKLRRSYSEPVIKERYFYIASKLGGDVPTKLLFFAGNQLDAKIAEELQRRERAKLSAKTRQDVLAELARLGIDFASLPESTQKTAVEKLLDHARMMFESLGFVLPGYINISPKKLQKAIEKRKQLDEEDKNNYDELDELLKARGLNGGVTNIPHYVRLSLSIPVILQKIKLIEESGIVFIPNTKGWASLPTPKLKAEKDVKHQPVNPPAGPTAIKANKVAKNLTSQREGRHSRSINVPLKRRLIFDRELPPQIKNLFEGGVGELEGVIVPHYDVPSDMQFSQQDKDLLARGASIAVVFYIPSKNVYICVQRSFLKMVYV